MSTNRDTLAGVIETAYNLNEGMVTFELLEAAILAAGYSKPRTIKTVDELDALPVGSVVIDGGGAGEVYRKLARHEGVKWYEPSYTLHWESHELNFPAMVIWESRP